MIVLLMMLMISSMMMVIAITLMKILLLIMTIFESNTEDNANGENDGGVSLVCVQGARLGCLTANGSSWKSPSGPSKKFEVALLGEEARCLSRVNEYSRSFRHNH